MKKKFIMLAVLVVSICIFSTKSFSQTAPGGDAGGTGGDEEETAITIDLGTAGVVSIPTTSPYYSLVTSVLSALHIVINSDGSVVFPTVSCYNASTLVLYYMGCLSSKNWSTACKNIPSSCHQHSNYTTYHSCCHH